MDIELTKEAKGAIALIYRAYEDRRKAGIPRRGAVYFSTSDESGKAVCSQVRESVQELKNAGLIKSDILGGVEITDKGIIFMENITSTTIKEWLSFLAQFIP